MHEAEAVLDSVKDLMHGPRIARSLERVQLKLELGRLQLAQSNYEQARVTLSETLETDAADASVLPVPDQARVRQYMAECHYAEGHEAEAAKEISQAVQLHDMQGARSGDDLARLHHILGAIRFDDGRHDEALAHFQHAVNYRRRIHGSRHLRVADGLYSLCLVHNTLRDNPAAKAAIGAC